MDGVSANDVILRERERKTYMQMSTSCHRWITLDIVDFQGHRQKRDLHRTGTKSSHPTSSEIEQFIGSDQHVSSRDSLSRYLNCL